MESKIIFFFFPFFFLNMFHLQCQERAGGQECRTRAGGEACRSQGSSK